MTNFDSYYDPPEDDPICEDFCGETLVRNEFSDGWFCANKFCPSKFQGVEQEMAFALVDAKDDLNAYRRYKVKYLELKEEYDELLYKWNDTNN